MSDRTIVGRLMLKTNWPGRFRRVFRDTVDGRQVIRTDANGREVDIVFQPGESRDVTAEEMELLAGDIGKSLLAVEPDDKGRPRIVTDGEEPSQIVQLETMVSQMQESIDLLIAQVKELGGEPVVEFEDDESDDESDGESQEEASNTNGVNAGHSGRERLGGVSGSPGAADSLAGR